MQDRTVPSIPFDLGLVRPAPVVPAARPGPGSDPVAFESQAMLLGRILDLSLTDSASRKEAEAARTTRLRPLPRAG